MVDGVILGECWLPVVGFEGWYEVSDYGRVRSVDRIVCDRANTRKFYRGRMLALEVSKRHGYQVANLRKPGVKQRILVHRLVLTAFVGPCPDDMDCGCHYDGNRTNNRLDNLRWDTAKANAQDTIRHGRLKAGGRYKERCKRGHLLREPNLYWHPNGTTRLCLACIKARYEVQAARERGIELDFQMCSDGIYDHLVESSQHEHEQVAPTVSPIPKRTPTTTFILNELTSQIRSGLLRPGTHLPPAREMCKAYGCSSTTVKTAYRCLAAVGLVEIRMGQRVLIVGPPSTSREEPRLTDTA